MESDEGCTTEVGAGISAGPTTEADELETSSSTLLPRSSVASFAGFGLRGGSTLVDGILDSPSCRGLSRGLSEMGGTAEAISRGSEGTLAAKAG